MNDIEIRETLRQALTDWDAATPAQRQAALAWSGGATSEARKEMIADDIITGYGPGGHNSLQDIRDAAHYVSEVAEHYRLDERDQDDIVEIIATQMGWS